MIRLNSIPGTLRERPQWVLWKIVQRDKPTKVPYQVNGEPAKANDPKTWNTFDKVWATYEAGGYDGIGYEFHKEDCFCGIDLDGCRNPESGEVAEWARGIILELATYAEISPSQTGVKLFAIAKLPTGGRKKEITDAPRSSDKTPAIEVYDAGRYFAVTGLRLSGPSEPQERQAEINTLCIKHWPAPEPRTSLPFNSPDAVIERARKYIAKLPAAVSGSSGHNATYHAACVLVCGFMLERGPALALLSEWNQLCQPPWSDRELAHKIDSALKQPGERGYLRNVTPQNFSKIKTPKYEAPQPKSEIKTVTMVEASRDYIESVRSGSGTLIELGLSDLDYALGGGVARGELVLIAGRPSHGKSLVALQIVHHWTEQGMPVLIISEEMSSLAIGKRALQHMSEIPEEHWKTSLTDLEEDLKWYEQNHALCHIAQSLRTTAAVCEVVEEYVEKHKVECVAVDYAQLLQSPGGTRYEQITNTSIALRQLATKHNIVLLTLCQLNRAIEHRTNFFPMPSDLKDTGQLEQDADVIIFGVWPHRLDSQTDAHLYQFFIGKNRNRAINQACVECRLEPSRQKIEDARPDNWEPAFDAFAPYAD